MFSLYLISFAVLFFWIVIAWRWWTQFATIGALDEIAPSEEVQLVPPPVSIVVTARDEEARVESAVRSMLAQDYLDYEVIVVDDGSTDRTGEILDSIADGRLRVIHLGDPPEGWIGKNYALSQGAEAARGDYIIFTDGDVQFQPSVLKRAVSFARKSGADHLVLFPHMILSTIFERLFIHSFFVALLHLHSPQRAQDPLARDSLGIGAFNMVRRSAYLSMGGHEPIRMNINDDVALGMLVKFSGFRTRFLAAGDLVRVLWHKGVRRLIRGLEKNAFAGIGFSLTRVLGAGLVLPLVSCWPYFSLGWGLASGDAIMLWCGIYALIALLFQGGAYCRFSKIKPGNSVLALAAPLGALFLMAAGLNSMVKTLWRGGVLWRGRFYSLRGLKQSRFPTRV